MKVEGGRPNAERGARGGRLPPVWSGLRAGLAAAAMGLASFAILLAAEERPTVFVVVGAAGEAAYRPQFDEWTKRWREAASAAGADFVAVGLDETNAVPDRQILETRLAGLVEESNAAVWLVFIGHGTFDGETPKFNLRGPDVSAMDLATWLQPWRRPVAIIQCASASGPFLAQLSHTNRVVITATQSGEELNFARFGAHLAESIADPTADLDKDGQTSLLEAFLVASRRVAEFYESEGRLATEHALLDDNGDRLGTPADWFEGVRAVRRAADGARPDGLRAHQFHLIRSERERQLPEGFRLSRDQLEWELETLRARKNELSLEVYFDQLERLLVRLARLYESFGQLPDSPAPNEPR
jgi:hypothetical protein